MLDDDVGNIGMVIVSCISHNLITKINPNLFVLLSRNNLVPNMVLSNSTINIVQVRGNWLYIVGIDAYSNTNDEMDFRE